MYTYTNRKGDRVIPVAGMKVAIAERGKFVEYATINRVSADHRQIIVRTKTRQHEFFNGDIIHKNGVYSTRQIKFDLDF